MPVATALAAALPTANAWASATALMRPSLVTFAIATLSATANWPTPIAAAFAEAVSSADAKAAAFALMTDFLLSLKTEAVALADVPFAIASWPTPLANAFAFALVTP